MVSLYSFISLPYLSSTVIVCIAPRRIPPRRVLGKTRKICINSGKGHGISCMPNFYLNPINAVVIIISYILARLYFCTILRDGVPFSGVHSHLVISIIFRQFSYFVWQFFILHINLIIYQFLKLPHELLMLYTA